MQFIDVWDPKAVETNLSPEELIEKYWDEMNPKQDFGIWNIFMQSNFIKWLWEKELVMLAQYLWMEASTKDKKSDTQERVLRLLNL